MMYDFLGRISADCLHSFDLSGVERAMWLLMG
jgi:hypothetical protein